MFPSEMIDKSSAVGAGDDDPADLAFADGANVAVISGSAVWLADVVSTAGRMLSRRMPQHAAQVNTCYPRVRHQSVTTACRMSDALRSVLPHVGHRGTRLNSRRRAVGRISAAVHCAVYSSASR